MTTDTEKNSLELMCVNTIRAVSADQVQEANSGHPGAPMGCAPLAHILWGPDGFLNYSSKDPQWINRDRFVLSNGHACALQYTMLHLTGYKDTTVDDLKLFRQLGSKTPGHPECFATEGIEVCTGPLGQGISNAVGLCVAERHLAATFNEGDDYPVFDHFTYVICGDGCLQEGVSAESSSLAGHLGLGRLILMYDDNQITIDGDTSLSFTEDVLKRYEAYGWHTQTVSDVSTSLEELRAAVKAAQAVTDKPSIIKVKTVIGYGSPNKAGKEEAHGAPLGKEELAKTKEFYGLPPDQSFYVPDNVQKAYKAAADAADAKRIAWEEMFAKYTTAFPEKAGEISRRFAKKLPDGIFDKLPTFESGKDKDQATRKFSQIMLGGIGPHMPELIGGSADLTPSNLTNYKEVTDFQKDSHEGRYLRFGVREHGMVAITNGIFAHGGLRPYCATFLTFVGYCAGAIRLSALSKFGVLFIMTHDSIGLGEDGPTHQPVETLETLRCIPNLHVFRPADSNETAAAYQSALECTTTPTVLCLSRQTVKGLERSTLADAAKGAYIVYGEASATPDAILIGTGTEVEYCMGAAEKLKAESPSLNVRVVSMPCQELFLEQSVDYQQSILPGNVPTLSVEAASINGWHRFSHAQIGMSRFGLSGPGGAVMKHFGFSVDNVATKTTQMVEFYKTAGSVPNLNSRPVFEEAVAMNGHH